MNAFSKCVAWAMRAMMILAVCACVVVAFPGMAQFLSPRSDPGCGIDQSCAAVSYEATRTDGQSGFTCISAGMCVDLGPGAYNQIGTNQAGDILICPEGSTSGCIIRLGQTGTITGNGSWILTNGALDLFVNTTIQNSFGTEPVKVDDPHGIRIATHAATPVCSAGNAGTLSTLSSTGAAFYCNGTAAQQVALRVPWSSSLDFSAFAGASCQTLTFTAAGAVDGEPIASGGCGDIFDFDADLLCMMAISATNTVSVRVCCRDETGGCGDPPATAFTAAAVR